MEALKNLSKRHKAFVKRVHSFRLPLGPMGQRVAGVVYFSIPVIAGYVLLQQVLDYSGRTLGSGEGRSLTSASMVRENKTKDIVPASRSRASAHRDRLQAELAALRDTPASPSAQTEPR